MLACSAFSNLLDCVRPVVVDIAPCYFDLHIAQMPNLRMQICKCRNTTLSMNQFVETLVVSTISGVLIFGALFSGALISGALIFGALFSGALILVR